jgi:hypothetical protein
MGKSLAEFFREVGRQLGVPEWARKSQPLKALAKALGIGQSARDGINAVLNAAADELEERFKELLGAAGDAVSGQLAGIIIRFLTDGAINWPAEGAFTQDVIDELREAIESEVDEALPNLAADLRAILIAEALRILLGVKPA